MNYEQLSGRRCNGTVEFENGYKFSEGHFLTEYAPSYGDVYYVWNEELGIINNSSELFNTMGLSFDKYYPDGTFLAGCWGRF